MKHCVPNELFNRVPYPISGTEEDVPIDGIYREVAYKLPGLDEISARKEIWHALCDFCARTGALMKKAAVSAEQGAEENQLTVDLMGNLPSLRFMRVVGAEADGSPTADFEVQLGNGNRPWAYFPAGTRSCEVTFAARPVFADETVSVGGKWEPKVPRYIIDLYGECIAHGALMRLYALRGDAMPAQMHATAYNNDLLRHSYGLITAGMRRHLMVDMEDVFANIARGGAGVGNG